jgi:CheY-like chemotaxis protein
MTTILVIEDQVPIRENLLELLEFEDYQAVGAEDGEAGLQLARQSLPDLVICDVMMPKLDGFEVLSYLRSDPATADIPFIFLTAIAWTQKMTDLLSLKADAYISKPFTVSTLIDAVRRSLLQTKHDIKPDFSPMH